MKLTSITHASTLLLITAISSSAFGSGFALNEQSARGLGQAFAGRASDADNASTLVTNPAGMSKLKNREIVAGFSFIDASSDVSDASATAAGSPVSGSNDGDMIPFTTIPFGYYVQPIDNHWAAGIGFYAPFGLATEHEDEFQGRYFGTVSDITVITIQPTVSYDFGYGLSAGIGITYNRFDGKLERAIFTSPLPGTDIHGKVEGDDDAWGYNIGLLYEINTGTRIGLTYYSKVKYTLEGDTRLTNLPLGLGNLEFDASLDVETPDRIDLGLTHQLTSQLTLHADITRTNWKTLDEIRVENEGAPALFAETVEPLDWEATMLYSLGLSYKVNPQWAVRGGIGFDEQPMSDSNRTVRLPAGDRTIFAIGATWSPMSNFDVDAGFMYIKEEKAEVNQTATVLGAPLAYRAEFENDVKLLSVHGSWRF